MLMERLAEQHPHHVLHHLMALKNGNCGRDGNRVSQDAAQRGAMVHFVDFDKLWAADAVLNSLCAHRPDMYGDFSSGILRKQPEVSDSYCSRGLQSILQIDISGSIPVELEMKGISF